MTLVAGDFSIAHGVRSLLGPVGAKSHGYGEDDGDAAVSHVPTWHWRAPGMPRLCWRWFDVLSFYGTSTIRIHLGNLTQNCSIFLGGCGRYRLAIIHSFLWYRYIMGNMYLLAHLGINIYDMGNQYHLYLWEICIYGMAILWVSCLLWALIRNFLGPWLSKSKDMRMQTARIACQRLGHIGHSIWIFTQG